MLAIILLSLLCFVIGWVLALSARALQRSDNPVAESINQLLPQTQCAQCGYPGCRPYANAIASHEAPINQCPPGGQLTIEALARLLDRPVIPLNAEFGIETPAVVALVDEDACIGCTLCIHACPVDAIVGAGKYMHTVIAAECTGCALCLPPCPVDCISLEPATRAENTHSTRAVTASHGH